MHTGCAGHEDGRHSPDPRGLKVALAAGGGAGNEKWNAPKKHPTGGPYTIQLVASFKGMGSFPPSLSTSKFEEAAQVEERVALVMGQTNCTCSV